MDSKRMLKWRLQLVSEQTLVLPTDVQLLAIQAQQGEICMWGLAGNDQPREERTFRIFSTGQWMSLKGMTFIGTVQIGTMVWHVFEDIKGR